MAEKKGVRQRLRVMKLAEVLENIFEPYRRRGIIEEGAREFYGTFARIWEDRTAILFC